MKILFFVLFALAVAQVVFKPSEGGLARTAEAIAAEHVENVVLYSAAWCGYCTKTREYLNQNSINFIEYDIDTSSEGRKQYNKLQGRGVPLMVVNGTRISGYDTRAIDAAL